MNKRIIIKYEPKVVLMNELKEGDVFRFVNDADDPECPEGLNVCTSDPFKIGGNNGWGVISKPVNEK